MSAPGDAGNTPPLSSHQQLNNLVSRTMDDLPRLTKATFIGIIIAITGNMLISLALNLQKLAHKRVEASLRANNSRRQAVKNTNNTNTSPNREQRKRSDRPSLDEHDEDAAYISAPPGSSQSGVRPPETEYLIPFPRSRSADYGTTPPVSSRRLPEQSRPQITAPTKKATFLSRIVPASLRREKATPNALLDAPTLPVDVVDEQTIFEQRRKNQKKLAQKQDLVEDGNETEYLKSKLWWLGFLLMNVGEMGNFISYAWAPASVVAPLGTFSLIANCILAPLLLGERFRNRDLLGILIAIIGAVTVVLASNASDTRLDSDALLRAISQTPFIIYSCVYIAGTIVLATLSLGRLGREWVFIDVGLCALFGGFTVLSTKAISTLITMRWIAMFEDWIAYPVLVVLVVTGVGQIKYLNRALMRFDSKVVIPVQFVLFTLSAITGSAILYGDFRKAKFHQIVTFLYGCAATFLGVFIIAWAPPEAAADPEGSIDPNSPEGRSITSEDERRLVLGSRSIGRRRATLIIPSGVPILRNQQSAVSLIGFSPAQHLLLVHTPPREFPISSQALSQQKTDRRRTMSWLDDSRRNTTSPGSTRENSEVRRLESRIGSLERSSHQ